MFTQSPSTTNTSLYYGVIHSEVYKKSLVGDCLTANIPIYLHAHLNEKSRDDCKRGGVATTETHFSCSHSLDIITKSLQRRETITPYGARNMDHEVALFAQGPRKYRPLPCMMSQAIIWDEAQNILSHTLFLLYESIYTIISWLA